MTLLLPTAVDSEYFAPLQVAFAYDGPFSDEANAEIDQRLQALSFRPPANPARIDRLRSRLGFSAGSTSRLLERLPDLPFQLRQRVAKLGDPHCAL